MNLQNPKPPTTHLNRSRTQVCTLSLAIPLTLPRHATHSPGPVNNKHYFFKAPYKMCIITIIRITKACPVITLSLFLSVQPVLPKWVPTGIPSHQHQYPLLQAGRHKATHDTSLSHSLLQLHTQSK